MQSVRPLVIMIHGFRGTHHGLSLIADVLPEYDILIPDIPGFGQGERLERYSLDQYVAWLHRLVTAQAGGRPVVLAGHSFGSIITSAYAAHHPDMVERLVLINPIASPIMADHRRVRNALMRAYHWVGASLPPRLGRWWLAAPPGVLLMSAAMTTTRNRRTRRFIHDQHRRYFSRFHDPASLRAIFTVSTMHAVAQVAGDIIVPTLVIVGDRDTITPFAAQMRLGSQIADARMVVIPRVGHLTHYETPHEVAGAMRSFIEASPRQS